MIFNKIHVQPFLNIIKEERDKYNSIFNKNIELHINHFSIQK